MSERWIKVKIKTLNIFNNKSDVSKCRCYWQYETDTNKIWCKIFNVEIKNGKRCQSCIDADITDKLDSINVLADMLNNKIKPELDALEKRNQILERAREIVKEDFCTATFEASLEKAEKEIPK